MMNRSLVYVVGLGPGGAQYLTAQAQTALQAADRAQKLEAAV